MINFKRHIWRKMDSKLDNHPAVKLGRWLRLARQKKGLVKRSFAGQIALTPAQYSEVEAGVVRWLGERQRRAIRLVLDLNGKDRRTFNQLIEATRKSITLSFSNVFSREELEPIRYRWNDKSKKPGEFEKEAILNAVFADIA
jgi:transcriptional regulator with XRE-family HTH domain